MRSAFPGTYGCSRSAFAACAAAMTPALVSWAAVGAAIASSDATESQQAQVMVFMRSLVNRGQRDRLVGVILEHDAALAVRLDARRGGHRPRTAARRVHRELHE